MSLAFYGACPWCVLLFLLWHRAMTNCRSRTALTPALKGVMRPAGFAARESVPSICRGDRSIHFFVENIKANNYLNIIQCLDSSRIIELIKTERKRPLNW